MDRTLARKSLFVGVHKVKKVENKNENIEGNTQRNPLSFKLSKLDKSKKELSEEKKEALHKEEITHLRNINHINISGLDIPDPITSFHDLTTNYKLNKTIESNIPYEAPSPIQMQTLPLMFQKREILAFAPTGSGKTAAFAIPVLNTCQRKSKKPGIKAVIVSPTRELAHQIHQECLKLSKGLELKIILMVAKSTENSEDIDNCDILITTPNKLVYRIIAKPPTINLSKVEWLIVDESDKLFEKGKHGFRNQLATIFKACTSSKICRAMFSATYMHDVEQWAQEQLENVALVSIGQKNTSIANIKQELRFVGKEEDKLVAFRQVVTDKCNERPMLVFVNSKNMATKLYQTLFLQKIRAGVIHSDLKEKERDCIMRYFHEGHVPILICTDLMGRGLDFMGVNFVLNYDLPTTPISYIHRVGRTGRAGRVGKALTFFTSKEYESCHKIAKIVKQADGVVEEYLLKKSNFRSNKKRHFHGKNQQASKKQKPNPSDEDESE